MVENKEAGISHKDEEETGFAEEQNMRAAEKYRYETHWSDEDEMFVATCPEFRSMNCLPHDEKDAAEELKLMVADCWTTYATTARRHRIGQHAGSKTPQ